MDVIQSFVASGLTEVTERPGVKRSPLQGWALMDGESSLSSFTLIRPWHIAPNCPCAAPALYWTSGRFEAMNVLGFSLQFTLLKCIKQTITQGSLYFVLRRKSQELTSRKAYPTSHL